MRFVAALLATILVGGTALLAPRPVYASAEASDTIYVGTSVIADGDGSCGDGGPDFSSDASGQGSVQDALMSAMLAVDDDGDTIVICGGQYTYTDDFGQYDGDADGAHDKITIRAEEGADAVLDGFNNNQQLMKFLDTDVLIDGIVFYKSGGPAIEVSSSDSIHALRVENSEFHGNLASNGAAIYAEDMDVTISDSTFGAEEDDLDTPLYFEGYNRVTFEGGALYATSSDLTRAARISVDGSAFVGNDAQGVSGGDQALSPTIGHSVRAERLNRSPCGSAQVALRETKRTTVLVAQLRHLACHEAPRLS
jgi:hypothetical protein